MHTNRDKYPKRLNTPEFIYEEPHIDPMHANSNGANVGGATSNTSVLELNGKHGYVSLVSSDKTITITPSSINNTINLQAGTAAKVDKLNTLTGDLSITSSDKSIGISLGKTQIDLSVSFPDIVNKVNTFTGDLTIKAGSDISINNSTPNITIASTYTEGTDVDSLNSLTGALTIKAGNGISIITSSPNITIANTGGGVTEFNGFTGKVSLVGSGIISINNNKNKITIGANESADVDSLNSLTGALKLVAGSNMSINNSTPNITLSNTYKETTDVRSLNSITGVVLLKAGDNISITNSGQSIAIAAKIVAATSTLLVSATHTDTLTGTVVKGDMIVGNATPKWSRLAGGTAGQALVISSSIPTWGTLSLAKTTGTLGVAQGGTSKATIAKGSILYASAADTIISLPIGTEGNELTVVGGVPAWGSHIERYYVTTGDIIATNLTAATAMSVPLLSFTYVSAGKYMIDGCLLVKTSVAACGVRFLLDTSSAVTIVAMTYQHQLATSGTITGGHCYADNTGVGTSSGLPSNNTVVPVGVNGMLIATSNAAGGCKFKMAGELNPGKVTLMTGSMLRVVKVA